MRGADGRRVGYDATPIRRSLYLHARVLRPVLGVPIRLDPDACRFPRIYCGANEHVPVVPAVVRAVDLVGRKGAGNRVVTRACVRQHAWRQERRRCAEFVHRLQGCRPRLAGGARGHHPPRQFGELPADLAGTPVEGETGGDRAFDGVHAVCVRWLAVCQLRGRRDPRSSEEHPA